MRGVEIYFSIYLKNVKTRQRASAKRKADTGFKWGEDE